MDLRIQAGFMNHVLGLKGLLYWQVDLWAISSIPSYSPWTNPNNTGDFSGSNYPGEGLLLYPGGPVGASRDVPSMRLKQLRDGVDDYDLVEILNNLGQAAFVQSVVKPPSPPTGTPGPTIRTCF